MENLKIELQSAWIAVENYLSDLSNEQQLALLLISHGLLLIMISIQRMRMREQSKLLSELRESPYAHPDSSVEPEKEEASTESSEPVEEELVVEEPEPLASEPLVADATAEESVASLGTGLTKTRSRFLSRLGAIFGAKPKLDAESFASLEELLITSDLGVKTTAKLLESLKIRVESAEEAPSPEELKKNLQSDIKRILDFGVDPEIIPVKREGEPLVVMVIGVNGVGKTTTIGKLAFQFSAQGAKVMIAACDTFRAAAVEQLSTWAERSGAEVVSGAEGAKPSTVAYQAVHKAKDEGFDVLIVDTAGRLHTRVNLMNELENVQNIIGREQAGAPHEVLLVLDASTGQNALQQAIEFNQRAPLSGVVVTKLDGTAKGGIVVAISDELQVPIRYIGVGESIVDLKLFSAEDFSEALFTGDIEADAANFERSKYFVGDVDTASEKSPEEPEPKKVSRKRRHQQV